MTAGFYTPTGPRCMVRMMDGIREGRCLDGESLDPQPGGTVQVYPCTKRWHQFVSFGNGKEVPFGSMHTTVPLHTRRRIAETGREQEPYMCFGVSGRGDLDEEDWFGQRGEDEEVSSQVDKPGEDETAVDVDNFSVDEDDEPNSKGSDGRSPLRDWAGEQLIATRCSNSGAIVEWIVVPFIVEEDESEEDATNSSATQSDEEEEL